MARGITTGHRVKPGQHVSYLPLIDAALPLFAEACGQGGGPRCALQKDLHYGPALTSGQRQHHP